MLEDGNSLIWEEKVASKSSATGKMVLKTKNKNKTHTTEGIKKCQQLNLVEKKKPKETGCVEAAVWKWIKLPEKLQVCSEM